jgi:HD associated region
MDADKLDFLIRDSVECRVQYGRGIDVGRFLRSLTTTAVLTSTGEPLLRLAIKRKGSASAEAFALARYQMYQSVYWHHTFRAIKGMLFAAAANILYTPREASLRPTLFSRSELVDSYLKQVLDLVTAPQGPPPHKTRKSTEKDIDRLMADKAELPYMSKYSSDKTIRFLWKLSSGKNRAIIEDLCGRRYYKRIYEISLGALEENSWITLREAFGNGQAFSDIQGRIEKALTNATRTAIQSKSRDRQSIVEDRVLETFEKIADNKHCFVIDLPTRGYTAKGDYPLFVRDYKRRHFRVDTAGRPGSEAAMLWAEHLAVMMREIVFFRVFGEPDIHRIVTRVLDSEAIDRTIQEAVPELKFRITRP